MRKLAAALLLSLLLPAAAWAKSYTLPDDNAVAVITVPDEWDAEEIADGVEASSPDESIYLAVEVANATDVRTAMLGALKYLNEQGVQVDDASAKQNEFEINGMKALATVFAGKDSDGPTVASITVVIVNNEKVLVMTYWASPDGYEKNKGDIERILGSIKRVGG